MPAGKMGMTPVKLLSPSCTNRRCVAADKSGISPLKPPPLWPAKDSISKTESGLKEGTAPESLLLDM